MRRRAVAHGVDAPDLERIEAELLAAMSKCVSVANCVCSAPNERKAPEGVLFV